MVTHDVVTTAVKPDGSHAIVTRRTLTPLNHSFEMSSIFDASAGRRIDFDADLKMKSTVAARTGSIVLKAQPTCSAPKGVEKVAPSGAFALMSSLQGVGVVPIATRAKVADRTIFRQALLAPSLGCMTLSEEIAVTGPDGSDQGVSRRVLQSVSFGAPNEALFQVPQDALEVSPSTIAQAARTRAGAAIECPSCVSNQKNHSDSIYQAHRPKQ